MLQETSDAQESATAQPLKVADNEMEKQSPASKEMGEALQAGPGALCHPGPAYPRSSEGNSQGRPIPSSEPVKNCQQPAGWVEWAEQLNLTGDQSL